MFLGATLQAVIGLARIALAVIALVGVPLADAVACTGDEPPASLEMTPDPPTQSGHTDTQPSDIAHCMHGHCHQAAAFHTTADSQGLLIERDANAPARNTSLLLPSVSGGLERPPKA